MSVVVTVADLLAVPGLGLRPVHVAPDPPPLRWVATSELPDPTPYLEGGELLLTTGLETKEWHAEWAPYVARLADGGLAALGFGVGLTHARMPDALLAACREHGLTLVEVPRPTAFVSVSQAAASLLQDEEERAARLALDHQRRLTQAALGMDTGVLLDRLGHVLEGAAASLGRDGEVVEGPYGGEPSLLDTTLAGAEVRRIRGRGFGAISTVTGQRSTTVVRPIGIEGRAESYLAVAVPGRLRAPEQSALTTAGALLGFAVERRADRRAADRRLRARALDFVLRGDPRTAGVLLEAAEHAVPLPARVRVVRATGTSDAVADALAALEDDVLVSVADGELVAVVAAAEAERVAGQAVAGTLRAGVGRAVRAAEAGSSHDTAAFALARTTSGTPLRRWEDVTDAGPMGLIPDEVARAFAATLLDGLTGEQRGTLAAFLRHHGSRGGVAEELGVHRNTVRNRITDIEHRLGADLDDPVTRVAAWIALNAPAEQT
jgi:PucR family transcriptional regulator, purine catabolism regulatory protein